MPRPREGCDTYRRSGWSSLDQQLAFRCLAAGGGCRPEARLLRTSELVETAAPHDPSGGALYSGFRGKQAKGSSCWTWRSVSDALLFQVDVVGSPSGEPDDGSNCAA